MKLRVRLYTLLLGWRHVRVEAVVYDPPRTIRLPFIEGQGFTIRHSSNRLTAFLGSPFLCIRVSSQSQVAIYSSFIYAGDGNLQIHLIEC